MIPMFSFPIPATSPIPAAPATPPAPAGQLRILLLCLAGAARTGHLGRLHGCRSLFGVFLLGGSTAANAPPWASRAIPGKAFHPTCPLSLLRDWGIRSHRPAAAFNAPRKASPGIGGCPRSYRHTGRTRAQRDSGGSISSARCVRQTT